MIKQIMQFRYCKIEHPEIADLQNCELRLANCEVNAPECGAASPQGPRLKSSPTRMTSKYSHEERRAGEERTKAHFFGTLILSSALAAGTAADSDQKSFAWNQILLFMMLPLSLLARFI